MNMVDPNKISEDYNGTENSSTSSKGENFIRTCIFCKKDKEASCSRINSNVPVLDALESLHIEYRVLPKVTDYGCNECFTNIMLLSEKRKLYQRNILKSRANYYIKRGDRQMCGKYLAKISAISGNFVPIITPGSSDLKITNVRTIRRSNSSNGTNRSENYVNGFIDAASNDNCNQSVNSSSDVLFDPMYEKPEPVVITESGGNVQNFMDTEQTGDNAVISNVFKCHYCPRTYKQQRFFRKHEKRHVIQNIQRKRNKSVTHTCSECYMTFESISELKSHKNIHKDKFKCSYCDEEFSLLCKVEFHEAICLGQMGAMQTNGRHKYYTRSQNRTKQSDSDDDSDIDLDDPDTRLYLNNEIKTWFNTCDCGGESGYSKAGSMPRSRLSTLTTFTSNPTTTDEDSVISTSNSKRNKIQAKNSIHSVRKDRKRKLEDLESEKWLCPVNDCGYLVESLDLLMQHDVEIHDPLPLFYCKKCRKRCVRRFYLEEHLKYQAYGRWVCCLCQAQFDNEPQLKDHFHEHYVNKKHKCEICTLTYITDHELQKHLCTQEHLNRKMMRRSIFLQRCVYKSAPAPTENKDPPPYKSTIKILKLMDQERTDRFDNLSWQYSWNRRLRNIRPDNKYGNCAGLVLPKSPHSAERLLQKS